MCGDGRSHAADALLLGIKRYLLYRRIGGFEAGFQKCGKIAEYGFDPRTVHLAAVRFNDWTIPAHNKFPVVFLSTDIVKADSNKSCSLS